jgi:hypothetical protein
MCIQMKYLAIVSHGGIRSFIGRVVTSCVLLAAIACLGCSAERDTAAENGRGAAEGPHGRRMRGDLARGQVDTRGAPRLVLEKTTYDFGQIKSGSANTAVFRLSNAGPGTLQIIDVRRCCGAVVELKKKELAPGESTELTAKYRAGQGPGDMTKNIGLVTNDPHKPLVELTITGQIIQTLTWTPTRLQIAAYTKDLPCPEITIKSLDGTLFSVEGFVATGQCLNAEFDPIRKATEFILKPTVDLARVNALTASSGTVRVNLDHPDCKSIDLAFSVIPALQVTPAQLLVFNARAGEPLLRLLQIKDNQAAPDSTTDVAIESVTSKSGGRVDIRAVTTNKATCELKVAIWPAGSNEKESLSTDQLLIEMKDGRKLSVPVRVFYASGAVSNMPNPDSNL